MKRTVGVAVVVASLAAVFGYMGWALWAMRDEGSLTGGSWVIGAMIAGGVLVTGLLGGGLMWLAFYSSRRGYDDNAYSEDP